MFLNSLKIFWDRINGIEYGPKIVKEIDLNDQTTINEIKATVNSINSRIILRYYDAFYNLPETEKPHSCGDLGAFTDVRLDDNKLYVRRGNHGWMDKYWYEIPKIELIEQILNSRAFNNGKMNVESRVARRIWKKEKNRKSLVYLYHKASK